MTSQIRGSIRRAFAGSIAFLSLLAFAPREASAQIPAPESIRWDISLDRLARAQVRLPRAVVLTAATAYDRAYANAVLRAVEDGVAIRSAVGDDAAVGSVPDVEVVRRVQELEQRAAEAERALCMAFFDSLAAAASPQDRAIIEAERDLRLVALTNERAFAGGRTTAQPDDLGMWLAGMDAQDLPPAELRQRMQFAATKAAVRIAAADAVRTQRLAAELASAQQEGGAKVAKDPRSPALWSGGRYRPEYAKSTEAAALRKQLVDAQLEAYRAIRPELTPAQLSALRQFWMPRLMGIWDSVEGMPRKSSGTGLPNGYTLAFLRVSGLDDTARARVREVGRAWQHDDDAILDAALDALLSGREPGDVVALRKARAQQAREQFAKVPGLAFALDADATLDGATGPVDPADEREFGSRWERSMKPTPAGDGVDAPVKPGLPVGYSSRFESDLASLLRLDEAQRAKLAGVMADARTRWNEQVVPMTTAAVAPKSTAEQRAQATRKAWDLADGLDAKTADAVAAALGDRADRGALALLCASRMLGRFATTGYADRTELPMDIAACILGTPMSDASRTAVCAAAQPLLSDWVRRVQEMGEQRLRRDRADALGNGGRRGSTGPDAEQARKQYAVLLGECDAAAGAIERAALAALSGADQTRLQIACGSLRGRGLYGDPIHLWRQVQRALECAPADQREALRTAAAPLLAEMERSNARFEGLDAPITPGTSFTPGTTFAELRPAIAIASRATAVQLQLAALFPVECWTGKPAAESGSSLAGTLARLCEDAPAAPAGPSAPGAPATK